MIKPRLGALFSKEITLSYFLFDAHSIGYAGQNGAVLKADGRQVQAIYNTLRSVKSIIDRHPQYTKPIFLWDDHAQCRLDIYPDYKSGRESTPEQREMRVQFRQQRPTIMRMLHSLGVDQLRVKGYEADDMAGILSAKATNAGHKTLLVTGDKDWLQLINSLTVWYDPIRERKCDRGSFTEFTGFHSVENFIQGKALQGDNSDAIAGVGGLGEKAAPLIIENYGSVEGLWRSYDADGEFTKENLPPVLSRYKKKLNDFSRDNRHIFERNMRLMDLRPDNIPKPSKGTVSVTRGALNMDKFREQCSDLAFHSIRVQLPSWERTFTR